MDFVASASKRLVRITGEPNSGWSAADPDDLNAREVEFDFRVTSDGNQNYLLIYESSDRQYCADSWHETIDQAIACAQALFGIEPGEWTRAA